MPLMESFFHTLKNELPKKEFEDLEDVRRKIFLYIDHWYNTERLHSSLKRRSSYHSQKNVRKIGQNKVSNHRPGQK